MSSTVISLDAAEHPVKSVTIFQSSTAELTRTFTADLKSGTNALEISGISSQVDRESPRIHGLGADARVVDISCNTTFADVSNQSQRRFKHAAALKDLASRRKLLEAERTVRQTELDLLDDAARSFVQDKATEFDAFMDAFVVRKRNAIKKVIEVDHQIEELDKEAWLLNNTHKGETAAVVVVSLLAKRDCKVEFQLTYLVTGVTWQPYYDLHATTSDGKPSPNVSLHYCANITQTTGEDWSNTVLTLSTANSHALPSLTVPKVDPLRLMPVRGFGARPWGTFGQTTSTGSASAFGQPASTGPAGGLFGQAASTGSTSAFGQPASTGSAGGSFGRPASTGSAGTQGLFGQPQQQQQQQSYSDICSELEQQRQQLLQQQQQRLWTGLFGLPQQQQQQQASASVSGQTPTPAPAPAPGPQPSDTTSFAAFGQQGAQSGGGSLFGQASAPTAGGVGREFSIFGNLANRSQAPSSLTASGGLNANPPVAVRIPLYSDISAAATAPAAATPGSEEEFEDIGKNTAVDEGGPGAVLDRNLLALAYRVEGRVTLPSDGVAHKVSIATLEFAAALKYVCVPRKHSAAFIEGRIKNTSEYELLAGPVSVFMDDSFVTKTLLGLTGVNESFVCVLGIDPALRVSYQTKSRTEHEPKRSFAEPSKTTTRTVTTTITNGHAFDLAGLVVRDAIPLGNDEAGIKVALRAPLGLADAKDGEEVTVRLDGRESAKVRWAAKTEGGAGGEKEGLFEWVCEVKAGKKVRLEAEWDVKAPSNLRWEEVLNAPFGRKKE